MIGYDWCRNREAFTHGEVARICRLSTAKLANLANANVIACWYVPNQKGPSRHRRYNREDVIDFAVRCKLSHVLEVLGEPGPASSHNGPGTIRLPGVARG